jgi:heme/copper-type cytochrome/quinol oxidase subunit 2
MNKKIVLIAVILIPLCIGIVVGFNSNLEIEKLINLALLMQVIIFIGVAIWYVITILRKNR